MLGLKRAPSYLFPLILINLHRDIVGEILILMREYCRFDWDESIQEISMSRTSLDHVHIQSNNYK